MCNTRGVNMAVALITGANACVRREQECDRRRR